MNRRDAVKAMGSIVLASASTISGARSRFHAPPSVGSGIVRGTINVVMGNDNGLVALTDSRLSIVTPVGVLQQLPTPGQKLFLLDSTSVCTIAGFVAAEIPFPGLRHTTSAVLQVYRAQLAANAISYHPSLSEKLAQLNFLLVGQLSLIADIRNKPEEARQFELQLTLAGYDTDGKARIVWSTLKVDPAHEQDWLVSVQESGEQVISGTNLTIKVRGVNQVAEGILAQPERYIADPAISRYLHVRGTREGLTTEEMKDLGRALARETAVRFPGVGGPNQVAVLRQNSPIEWDQIAFPPETSQNTNANRSVQPIRFSIIADNIFASGDDVVGGGIPGHINLIIHNSFEESTILIDGNYFAANSFKHCVIVYRGGNTIFAANQDMTKSILAIGNEVDRRSETASHLINDFHWANVTTIEATKSPSNQ